MKRTKFIGAFLLLCGILSAQPPPNQNAGPIGTGNPIYRTTVIDRTVKAIDYRSRSGSTTIDFEGTPLLPKSNGEAKVESKQGYIEIEVEFDELSPATQFGSEYLTYVMWAITPEGRATNLGEVLLNGNRSKLNVTTEMQSFGLVVTAEPYFAVSQPSDVVVMENVVRSDTRGKVEVINARYELLKRGTYVQNVGSDAVTRTIDPKVPLEMYEAYNAVRLAQFAGADHYASAAYKKATDNLKQAEFYLKNPSNRKPAVAAARVAVQTAEDSRLIAVQRQEAEQLAMERSRAAEREAKANNARVAAQSETARISQSAEMARLNSQAETARLTREKDAQAAAALAEANRVKQATNARTSAAAVEADRLKLENEARIDAAKLEADRLKLASDARLAAAKAEADRLERENAAQRAVNQAQLDASAKQATQLEADKMALRSQLQEQFNAVLQTRDTARGLIVNMSDVLFSSGQYSLQPAAREKLAKVAGIIAGHPGLMLSVEGHTDSVGSDDSNQRLSERRGSAVRDYLTEQGIPAGSVTSKGLGETQPVATNDTASGRQQNRRVELVISGDLIGTEIGTTTAAR